MHRLLMLSHHFPNSILKKDYCFQNLTATHSLKNSSHLLRLMNHEPHLIKALGQLYVVIKIIRNKQWYLQ